MKSKRCDNLVQDVDLRNALSWACEGGHDKTVKVLIKYDCPGADDEDVNGWTPLAWALS
jgi:ankyrin repeat protein